MGEVKIAEDGEILCKGPNVMQGYYKDPEKQRQLSMAICTGDIGEFDADGFLRQTERKNSLKPLVENALRLSPNQMKQSLFIEQIMVIGEDENACSTYTTGI